MNISNIYKYFNAYFNKYNPYFTSIELGGFAENHFSFLVNEASRNALKERANISQKHFEEAINKFPPSISERQLKKYETFSNNRNFV